ncbi:kinase-like protein [Rickenella mellea]|uniref:Kinase-like protein n=1 Tax=Rickenella mellea TaxID=50990 RepID=A0A4Y7Q8E8_9AGAM|nr:kinase-like protein [Rickenella mellea]
MFGKLNERLVASYVVKILEGLHYLHQSDVVHCDLKAANILTTKNGNVKLSDFGVSLNLRQMKRENKNDVAGTPNWMAPEVIELKGASTASDIWSLACTVIELLTGKPPYSDVGNGLAVMYRIVEDDMPPVPEDCSETLKDFLRLCFQKDPSKRPNAEMLCEHEWLKKNWGAHKELRPQDSIPFLRRVSAEVQKSDANRYLHGIDIPRADSQASGYPYRAEDLSGSPPGLPGLPGSPPRQKISNGPTSPTGLESETSLPREHSFVKTTFSKPVTCRVCMQSIKKNAQLCEDCSLIAHRSCTPNAPPTCGLRKQLLEYAQYSPTGPPINPWDIIAAQQQFSAPTSPFMDGSSPPTPEPPPTAFKKIAFKRQTRTSLSPEPPASRATSRNSSKDGDGAAFPGARSNSSQSQNPGQGQNQATVSPSASPSLYPRVRKPSLLQRARDAIVSPRPVSFASSSVDDTPPQGSMRSAATAGESVSSRGRTDAVRSPTSMTMSLAGETDLGARSNSRFSSVYPESLLPPRPLSHFAPSSVGADYDESQSVPGGLEDVMQAHEDKKRLKKRESKASSNGGCSVQ